MNYERFAHPHTAVYLIDMKQEKGYISEIVQQSVRKHLAQNKKILILTNKTGYASGIFCKACGHIPQCHQCSVSIGFHKSDNDLLYGLCSLCKSLYDYPTSCPQCQASSSLQLYGLTTQKVQEWIETDFHVKPLVMQASDAASRTKAQKLYEQIKISPIVIATYALIPVEERNLFDLVIVMSADQSLALPDYTVRSQTFYALQRIIQRWNAPFVLIQSYDTDHQSIRCACADDVQTFEQSEQEFRQQYGYPPYGELCIIKYKHEQESTLHTTLQKLASELAYLQQAYDYQHLEIFTSSPLVYKKFGKYYYHIVIKGQSVRPFMDIVFSKLQLAKRGFKIDWMADSLL